MPELPSSYLFCCTSDTTGHSDSIGSSDSTGSSDDIGFSDTANDNISTCCLWKQTYDRSRQNSSCNKRSAG